MNSLNLFSFVTILICVFCIAKVSDSYKHDSITVTVEKLETRIVPTKKSLREDFYIIVKYDDGRKETLVSSDSYMNGKFNNADIFYRLKENSKYRMQVCGFGKGLFFDYRNILTISQID